MAKPKKRSKTRVRRKILLCYSIEKFNENFIFYTNGEYRMKAWETGDYSKWRILDGIFQYKHSYDSEYQFDDEDCSDLVKALEKAKLDLAFEKIVLK